jgi:hypothetical protein
MGPHSDFFLDTCGDVLRPSRATGPSAVGDLEAHIDDAIVAVFG